MQYRSQLHHHYCECEEIGAFPAEIGIELYDAGGIFQKAAVCGHLDFPLAPLETIEAFLKEKRHYPSTPAELYSNLPDL